jgi:predicted nucleotidyltransferase
MLQAARMGPRAAFDLHSWVHRVRSRYPDLGEIALFGSRGRGTHREDSDYDVVIVVGAVDEALEKTIATEFYCDEVDLFFLRPRGSRPGFGKLRRWADPPPNEREVEMNVPVVLAIQNRAQDAGLAHGLLSDDVVDRALRGAKPL